jgi:antitoxin (DNA-binding transcriptional repressor) of toxin-antitoxin stability system
MRYINVREMRSMLGKLDILVKDQQELIITRNKQAIARILPMRTQKIRPTHADLRALQQQSPHSATELIRQDRDER